MNKVKVLFLAAYPDASPLKLDEEIRSITQKIRIAEHRDIDLVSAWAARPDDLLQMLNEHKPNIVHFSGHGSSRGEIILIDENLVEGERLPKPVSPVAIKALFQVFKDNVQVVLLNACFSQIQAEALKDVIDCVIGMNAAIGDQAAIVFAASFYRALGFRRSVKEAFEQGKVALLLEGIPEADIPKLLCKPGIDPAQVFLVPALEKTTSPSFISVKQLDPPHLHIVESHERLITIGRAPKNTIQILDSKVSWEQGQILLMQGEYYYRHLSKNVPTVLRRKGEEYLLEDNIREEIRLRNQDRLVIGNVTLIVEYGLINEDNEYITTEVVIQDKR